MNITVIANEVYMVDDGHESYYSPIQLMAMGDYGGNLTVQHGIGLYTAIHLPHQHILKLHLPMDFAEGVITDIIKG